jgi:hypothetical protein
MTGPLLTCIERWDNEQLLLRAGACAGTQDVTDDDNSENDCGGEE